MGYEVRLRIVPVVICVLILELACRATGSGLSPLLGAFTGITMYALGNNSSKPVFTPPTAIVFAFYLMGPYVGMVVHAFTYFTMREMCRVVRPRGGQGESLKMKAHSFMGSVDCGQYMAEFLGKFTIEFMGDKLDAHFITDIDASTPVLDEYQAIRDHKNISEILATNFDLMGTYVPYGAFILLVTCLMGPIGFISTVVWAYYVTTQATRRKDNINSDNFVTPVRDTNINIGKGIYALTHSVLGYQFHLGVAYSDGRTLYSMVHVTRGNPIQVCDMLVYPSYVNHKTDTVTYGGSPRIANILDGDEVTVALSSCRSNSVVMYRSKVMKDNNGLIMFRGNKSTPGTSGSPIFVYREVIFAHDGEEKLIGEYTFAGCAGWFMDSDPNTNYEVSDKVGTEVVYSNPGVLEGRFTLNDNDVMQIFSYPGSGKTWKTIPSLVESGIAKYGRVYVTGPSLVVCEQLAKSLNQHWPGQIAQLTSDASILERGGYGRKILIAAHDTMLSFIQKGHYCVNTKGLWIVDEAHFANFGTMALVDTLRDRAYNDNKGCVVELTATGYNLQTQSYEIKDNSNYAIEDVTRDEKAMVKEMMEEAEDHKVIVFVERVHGSGHSMDRLNKVAGSHTKKDGTRGLDFVNLSRKTFGENYQKAITLEKGLIFTTDIAECGANFGAADTVYDFQRSPKSVNHHPNVTIEGRLIDIAQRVQRRGRIGRVKSGRYVSPNYKLDPFDTDRAEYRDRQIYCDALGIQCLEPRRSDAAIKLTPQQVTAWVAGGMEGINSPYLVDLLYHPSGYPKTGGDLHAAVRGWLNDKRTTIQIDGVNIECAFFDKRDEKRFKQLYSMLGGDFSVTRSISSWLGRVTSTSQSSLQIEKRCSIAAKTPFQMDNNEEMDGNEEEAPNELDGGAI